MYEKNIIGQNWNKKGSDFFMEKYAEDCLKEIDHPLFQNEDARKQFVKLIIQQAQLENELYNVVRQINALKNKYK